MSLSTTQYGYIVDPMVPFTDDKGKTIKNGFIRVFMAGTSTPVLTYRNYDGATNQEKIELDNSGRVKHNVIGSKGSLYKVVVYNILHSQENPLLTVDKIAVLGANVTGTTVITGLDSVTVPEENFLKATVEGTGGELALDPTEVTSEVSTIASAVTAAPDYVVPLLDKTGEGDSKKISLANLFKFALDWISRLATTITSFASGDFIAVSNTTDGTRKMSKDTLLELTAQNALGSIKDLATTKYKGFMALDDADGTGKMDVDTIFNNFAGKFDPTRTEETKYPKNAVVVYSGKLFKFDNPHWGDWSLSDVTAIDLAVAAGSVVVMSDNEYLFSVVDSNGVFLFGIRYDGTINWQKGIPDLIGQRFAELNSFLQQLLAEKVDKESGKSLINEQVAESNSIASGSEFLYAVIDSDGRIVFAIKENSGDIESPILDKKLQSFASSFSSRAYVDDAIETEKTRAESAEQTLQRAIDSIQPTIVEGGENNPDNEFLTSINDTLTFKDLVAGIGNKGICYIHAGDVFSTKCVLENTIYVIRYAINLDNASVTIPSGCVLFFEGGSIYGGTLVGNGTQIVRRNDGIFGDTITLSGSWNVEHINSRMIQNSTDENVLRKLCPLMNDSIYNEFVVEKENNEFIFAPVVNNEIFLDLKSNTKLIVAGTIKVKPNRFPNYRIISSHNRKFVEICGGGVLKGDADEHDYTSYSSSHEWGHCVRTDGCSGVSIHGLTIQDATGDGVDTVSSEVVIYDLNISHCGRQGVSVSAGKRVTLYNLNIDDIYRTAPMAGIDVEGDQGQIEAVKIFNIRLTRCKGIHFISAKGVSVENVFAENCSKMFYGQVAEDISIRNVRYSGELSVSIQDWVDFRNSCDRVTLEQSKFTSESQVEIKLDNIFLGIGNVFEGNVSVFGNPTTGSIRYSSGKYTQWNGTSWVNMDGSEII